VAVETTTKLFMSIPLSGSPGTFELPKPLEDALIANKPTLNEAGARSVAVKVAPSKSALISSVSVAVRVTLSTTVYWVFGEMT